MSLLCVIARMTDMNRNDYRLNCHLSIISNRLEHILFKLALNMKPISTAIFVGKYSHSEGPCSFPFKLTTQPRTLPSLLLFRHLLHSYWLLVELLSRMKLRTGSQVQRLVSSTIFAWKRVRPDLFNRNI